MRKNKIMANRVVQALAIIAFSNIAMANEGPVTNQAYITPFFDYMSIDNQALSDKEQEIGAGIDLGYKSELFGYRARIERVSGQNKANDSTAGRNIGADLLIYPYEKSYLFTGIRHNKFLDSKISPVLGAGFEHQITKNWGLRFEAGAMADTDIKSHAVFANIGMTYRFDKTPQKTSYIQPKKKLKQEQFIKIDHKTLDVKFMHDSSVIDTMYEDDIAEIAETLLRQPNSKVVIEGHASLVGTQEYNLQLSQKRADAITNRMVTTYGVSKNQLKGIGYGDSSPVSKLSGEDADAENRRVIAIITTKTITQK
jgi:outer membrane protein OmpA-like peptidoglycan-associated protein